MVNIDSTNYCDAKINGYLLNKGYTIPWWHGKGGLLDYTNPDAIEWWHK